MRISSKIIDRMKEIKEIPTRARSNVLLEVEYYKPGNVIATELNVSARFC